MAIRLRKRRGKREPRRIVVGSIGSGRLKHGLGTPAINFISSEPSANRGDGPEDDRRRPGRKGRPRPRQDLADWAWGYLRNLSHGSRVSFPRALPPLGGQRRPLPGGWTRVEGPCRLLPTHPNRRTE